MNVQKRTARRNPFRVADLFCRVTQGRLSRNRANPGLNDTIPSGLADSSWTGMTVRPTWLKLSVQVYDFSPVRTIFRVFTPISQPQGFDFSPVAEKWPLFFPVMVRERICTGTPKLLK